MSEKIVVKIADMNIGRDGDLIVTYALGSCVGVVLYDKMLKKGGLVHVLMPDSKSSKEVFNRCKYADLGVDELVKKLESMGVPKRRLTAKIAGGAQMFKTDSSASVLSIGKRNVESVRKSLKRLNIPIIGEDVGLDYGRTVYFHLDTGKVIIKSIKHDKYEI